MVHSTVGSVLTKNGIKSATLKKKNLRDPEKKKNKKHTCGQLAAGSWQVTADNSNLKDPSYGSIPKCR